jgi:hypothetical protein
MFTKLLSLYKLGIETLGFFTTQNSKKQIYNQDSDVWNLNQDFIDAIIKYESFKK